MSAASTPSPAEFEKLGAFYLGRRLEADVRTDSGELMLYDSRHLLTHALCVGMTGSGKTGLSIALLEEAAIDGVPAIVIDPKGDLSNLLLTFPSLAATDFLPYVDEAESARRGVSAEAVAAEVAESWRAGLAAFGQDGARVQRLRDACEVTIFTPGSSAGRQLSLLGALTAPPAAVVEDAEAFAGLVEGTASGLLALAGEDAELRSPAHAVLSQILARAWSEGRDLDLASVVQTLQKPPFDRVGALDLDTFFAPAARAKLASAVNALLASPAAATWAKGEPLDPERLLRAESGKPRIAIVSIAHLSDAQRMFFVTTLLDALIGWMRRKSGTTSLRALLLMDEIYGYFPPTAAPPSKRPMLTLLKQARAFGLGIVLATQNPVDLDYKGLANCGTWFLGKLQAERDKLRVLDGLEGAAAASGQGVDRADLDRLLSSLGGRAFYCHDVHGGSGVFRSRHTLSYLRGPLTREQIAALSPKVVAVASSVVKESAPAGDASVARPPVPGDVEEVFFPTRMPGPGVSYRPGVLATGKLHYVQAKAEIDFWQPFVMVAPLVSGDAAWSDATPLAPAFVAAARPEPEPGATFELPPTLSAKIVQGFEKSLGTFLYQERPLELFEAELPPRGTQKRGERIVSTPGETVEAFRARVALSLRESRDAAIAELDKKVRPKFEALAEKIRRADAKIQEERADVAAQRVNTAVSVGTGVLGAVFGRGVFTGANASRAGAVVRSAQRAARQEADVARAEADAAALREKWAALQAEANEALRALQADPALGAPTSMDTVRIAPRKGDTSIDRCVVAWVPFRDGRPAW